MDESFQRELDVLKAKRKKRKIILLVLALLLIPTLAFGGYKGMSAIAKKKDVQTKAVAINQPNLTDTQKTPEIPSGASTGSAAPTVIASSNPSATSPSVDSAAVAASLCTDYIKNKRDSNNYFLQKYYEAQKTWLETYGNNPNSPEAIDSKNFYKNWYQTNYNQLVSSLNAFQDGQCVKGKASTILVEASPW